MELTKIVEGIFRNPPVSFDPGRSSFKAWVMYCLRDRGFKVVYADKGDFAVELRGSGKVYFRVSETAVDPDSSVYWVVRDPSTQQVTIMPPQS